MRRRVGPLQSLSTAFLATTALLVALATSCGGTSAPPAPVSGAVEQTDSSYHGAVTEPEYDDGAPPAAVTAPVVRQPLPLAWASAPSLRGSPPPPLVNAVAAVLIDEASGAVLFDKDAHVSLPPASLTKIATLILALESGKVDDWVDVDVDSREMRGSTIMGLLPGDRFTLRDLCYGLMLPSGNDAALAIGRYVSGSDERFVAAMNNLVARQGLSESHFINPHGLGGTDHVTSAYDLAMLSRYGMSLPEFADIVRTPYWQASGSRVIPLANINTFLFAYRGADGLKTGYTRRAGQTLAASAWRDGHRLYAIVLNSGTRDDDARRLLDWGFRNFVWE